MLDGMQFLDWLQFAGSFGFLVSLVPQLIRTVRRKRAEDVDVTFLVILLVSSVILLVYALRTGQEWFAVSYCGNLVVWGVVLYYRVRPTPTRSGS